MHEGIRAIAILSLPPKPRLTAASVPAAPPARRALRLDLRRDLRRNLRRSNGAKSFALLFRETFPGKSRMLRHYLITMHNGLPSM